MANDVIYYLTNTKGEITHVQTEKFGPIIPVFTPDDLKAISPEWLESKGFVLVTEKNQQDIEGAWDLDMDVDMDEDSLCYLENKLDRKQFCIILMPFEYTDGTKAHSFEVRIREDIGCGFVSIPNQFSEMTEYHFSLLYEAIRRKKL